MSQVANTPLIFQVPSIFASAVLLLATFCHCYAHLVDVNILNKAKTRTAVGIHHRERVGAGRPLSPAGNWRMLINCSKWRTIVRNRFGSNLSIICQIFFFVNFKLWRSITDVNYNPILTVSFDWYYGAKKIDHSIPTVQRLGNSTCYQVVTCARYSILEYTRPE